MSHTECSGMSFQGRTCWPKGLSGPGVQWLQGQTRVTSRQRLDVIWRRSQQSCWWTGWGVGERLVGAARVWGWGQGRDGGSGEGKGQRSGEGKGWRRLGEGKGRRRLWGRSLGSGDVSSVPNMLSLNGWAGMPAGHPSGDAGWVFMQCVCRRGLPRPSTTQGVVASESSRKPGT